MKVAIVGGTHGNEKCGLFVLEKFRNQPQLLPEGLECGFFVGNPSAVEKHQRYVDRDLNRCYKNPDIPTDCYEYSRMQQLEDEVRGWARGEPFFMIDLHTTTTNMGTCLILSKKDRMSATVANKVIKKRPSVRLIFDENTEKGNLFVTGMAPHSLSIEVGPISQNTFDPKGIESVETALIETLQALQDIEDPTSLPPLHIQGLQEGEPYLFPNENQIFLISSDLYHQEFRSIAKGTPLFTDPQGKTYEYEGEETIIPIFIGEAAYLERGIAFVVGREGHYSI